MIKAIIFDFDGVIVESVEIKTNAFAKLFEHEGGEIVKRIVNYHLDNTGISRYEKFKYIYKEILNRPLNDDEFQMLCNKFSVLVVDSVVSAPYVKGAEEFVENYASRYKCFVVSATPQREIEQIVQKRNMNYFFKGIYGAPTTKKEAVKAILLKENLKPTNVLYVGDAISDYKVAKDNSVNFVARINNNESIFAEIDCLKIKDLTNLQKILETL